MQAPTTPERLASLRSLPKGFERSKWGEGILEAVKRGLARDPEDAAADRAAESAPNGAATVELLKVLLRMTSERHGVAAKVIATVDDLDRIAADDEADVPALKGWRRELFGEKALALKHGQLALAIERSRVVAVERNAPIGVSPPNRPPNSPPRPNRPPRRSPASLSRSITTTRRRAAALENAYRQSSSSRLATTLAARAVRAASARRLRRSARSARIRRVRVVAASRCAIPARTRRRTWPSRLVEIFAGPSCFVALGFLGFLGLALFGGLSEVCGAVRLAD